jgi:hypothetical protein
MHLAEPGECQPDRQRRRRFEHVQHQSTVLRRHDGLDGGGRGAAVAVRRARGGAVRRWQGNHNGFRTRRRPGRRRDRTEQRRYNHRPAQPPLNAHLDGPGCSRCRGSVARLTLDPLTLVSVPVVDPAYGVRRRPPRPPHKPVIVFRHDGSVARLEEAQGTLSRCPDRLMAPWYW